MREWRIREALTAFERGEVPWPRRAPGRHPAARDESPRLRPWARAATGSRAREQGSADARGGFRPLTVVADAGPLIALAKTGGLETSSDDPRVSVPPAVHAEAIRIGRERGAADALRRRLVGDGSSARRARRDGGSRSRRVGLERRWIEPRDRPERVQVRRRDAAGRTGRPRRRRAGGRGTAVRAVGGRHACYTLDGYSGSRSTPTSSGLIGVSFRGA